MLTPIEFTVGFALCEFMGSRDECWPNREQIRQRTRLRRIPTISAAITRLVGIGFIDRERTQRGVRYRLRNEILDGSPDDAPDGTPDALSNDADTGAFNNPDGTLGVTPEPSDGTPTVPPENGDIKSRRNASRLSDGTPTVPPITLIQNNKESSASAADEKTQPPPPVQKRRAPRQPAPKVTLSATGFAVPDAMLTAWVESYPLLDVNQEIKAAYARFLADGQKKTAYGKYLSNWLARSERWRVERGGPAKAASTPKSKFTPSTGEAKRMMQFFDFKKAH